MEKLPITKDFAIKSEVTLGTFYKFDCMSYVFGCTKLFPAIKTKQD